MPGIVATLTLVRLRRAGNSQSNILDLIVHVMMFEPAKITSEKATPESRYSINGA